MGWEVFANLSLASWGPRPGIPPDDCKSFPKRLWTEEQGCHLMDGLNRNGPPVEVLFEPHNRPKR